MQYGSVPISEVQYGSTPIGEGWMWSGGGWVQVFQAGAHYVDEFNRPNGALGADWLGSPQPTINSNAAQNSTSSGNVPQLTEYAKKLNTDRYGVLATVKTPVGTNRSAETYFYLSGRCTGTGVQNDDIVLLVAAGAALASGIYTRSASGTFTSRVPISGGWTSGQTAELRCDGNVYTAFRAGVQVAQWTDSGMIAPVDAGHRGFGFGTQPFNNGFGFAIDRIEAYDLA